MKCFTVIKERGFFMYTYEYRFYPNLFEQTEENDFVDDMQWFISSLYKNGQILSAYQNTVKCSDYFACRVVALEIDSLGEKYFNKYTTQFLKDVIKISKKPPELIYIGENYDVEDCCTCASPSSYILYTDRISFGPPIVCGDCRGYVPLYKFPKTYDETEYYDLLGWQKAYQACDRQFFEGIGERHAYNMMHDPNSFLSKEALRYSRLLEEKIGKPFYYFLFTYYKNNKPICPKCGEPWCNQDKEEKFKLDYDYVCHRCRLVSDDPLL